MRRVKRLLAQIIVITFVLSLGFPRVSSVLAQDPINWQGSATGLSVEHNEEKKTAGLGFVVQAENWPFLSLQGGVENAGYRNCSIAGPIDIQLGSIKLPESGTASLTSEALDWAHNEMTFTSEVGSQVRLWVSRLSPALLVQSSSSALRLLAGDVTGNVFDGSTIVPRPEGPAYPKYVAYTSGGNLQIETLGASSTPLSLDQNWLLLWYGGNSHFVDTKAPLTYTGYNWEKRSYLPHSVAYQADAPLLLVFQNLPTAIAHSDEGGVEITFAGASGYVALLPLFGREHPNVTETENWSQGLPSDVLQKAQWWADHLCSYPVGVSETYAYSESTDTATITENINFLDVCSGGTKFAPIPPILGIAKDGLNVTFSGSVIDANLNTEFGPTLGIENTQVYAWHVAGLKKYTDPKRIITNTGQAPAELEAELLSQMQKIIGAGHFAPWVFSDSIPSKCERGDIYWLNPADTIYHLVEMTEVLPDDAKNQLIGYIQSERSTYPPEDVHDLPLDEGTVRTGFALSGQDMFNCWLNLRDDVFLENVPLYSFYALSRYYDLTGETLSSQVWQEGGESLDRDMSEQDWATFSWFRSFADRRVAVINANRHFSGLVGFIRLAQLEGDVEAESLGRALLAKAAVLRLGMAKYPRYLYSAGLVELPPEPDWQVRYTAGRLRGEIFNYDWTGPFDDARQVAMLDQFGVYLFDHSGYREPGGYGTLGRGPGSAHLSPFRDMTPELARFLTDFAQGDVEIYMDKVEALFPHWYAAFAEGALGTEHNISHPIDSFQIFMAKAWIQQEAPQELAAYVDIPWLHEGDLFYAHKLAETMRAYRGTTWDDTLLLHGTPRDRAIHLIWRVYATLPSETTWQIDYQSGTGTAYVPITGIISPTRAYTLTGLTNYVWYTVTLTALHEGAPLLDSNAVSVMPTDIFLYLPLIIKEYQ